MSAFHPDLALARFIPHLSMGPRSVALMNRIPMKGKEAPPDLLVDDVTVPGLPGNPDVPLRLYRPRTLAGAAPALLWIHGGGLISGSPLQDERTNIDFARTLGITVAAVTYRLAPQHPAPAALEDAFAALRWLSQNSGARGIDPDRIAIGGASAGGGLAAGLALMARDRGDVVPAFQLLLYPMIDDRTTMRTDIDTRNLRMWTTKSNLYGWTSYLGRSPGGADVSPYAAPARSQDLSGLPPAWIGVGTLDLFHDEDVAYAERLNASGVPCTLDVIDGAFHGFNAVMPKAAVSKEVWWSQANALRAALFPGARGAEEPA
jgi:acetyl esterase/lipase